MLSSRASSIFRRTINFSNFSKPINPRLCHTNNQNMNNQNILHKLGDRCQDIQSRYQSIQSKINIHISPKIKDKIENFMIGSLFYSMGGLIIGGVYGFALPFLFPFTVIYACYYPYAKYR